MIRHPLIACAVAGATGGLVLLACGSTGPERPEPPTELIVAVRPEGSQRPVQRRHVRCPPDSMRPVCRRLRTTPRTDFAPVPPEAICTAIYGGPATATVEGRLRGQELEARFDLRNGCEIARWERFAWLLGDPPGANRGGARVDPAVGLSRRARRSGLRSRTGRCPPRP